METHFLRDMKMSKVMNRAMRRKHQSSTVLFLPGGTSWLSSPALEWTLNMQLRDYIWQEARDSSLIYTCVDIHRTAVVAPAMKMNAKTFPWSRLMLLVKGRCSPIFTPEECVIGLAQIIISSKLNELPVRFGTKLDSSSTTQRGIEINIMVDTWLYLQTTYMHGDEWGTVNMNRANGGHNINWWVRFVSVANIDRRKVPTVFFQEGRFDRLLILSPAWNGQ